MGTQSTPVKPSHTKKRKHQPQSPEDVPTKKQRTEEKLKRREEKKRDKGKAKETDQEFVVVASSMVLSVPPLYASDPQSGVEEMLDSMVMRYIPALGGVVLSYSNLRFLQPNAPIKGDCPFLLCKIAFDAMVWSPSIGMKLEGRINLCSPDHISLLVHRTFNVSIPWHHIPNDVWQFEYGPAENDPEFGPDAPVKEEEDVDMALDQEEGHSEVGGKWMNVRTDQVLSVKKKLEFTVIGLTVANEMLSLMGSIQPDPFSPEHQARPDVAPNEPPIEVLEDVAKDSEDKQDGVVEKKKKKKKKKKEPKEDES